MINNRTVSIIVPVYNQELYIKECIDSILSQTYNNFELILVDNGSSDESINICEKYAKIDKRIKVIKEAKRGVSSARNAGLKNATGKYIAFTDADDTIECAYLKELVSAAIPGIMPVCKMAKKYRDQTIYPKTTKKNNNSIEKYKSIETPGIEGYVWNRLFDAEIIKKHNIKFDEKAYLEEDTLFTIQYIKYISKIRIINEPLYNYRMRAGSAARDKEDVATLEKIKKIYIENNLPTNNIEYKIIRAIIKESGNDANFTARLAKYIKNIHYPIHKKMKLIALLLVPNNEKKEKGVLYE